MKFLWRILKRWFAPKTIVLELPAAAEIPEEPPPVEKTVHPLEKMYNACVSEDSMEHIASTGFNDQVDTLLRQGQELETLQWLVKFTKLKHIPIDKKIELERTLAKHYRLRGDGGLAEVHLGLILSKLPDDIEANASMAKIHQERGNLKLASTAWQKVYALDANFPNIQNRLSECNPQKTPALSHIGATTVGLQTASFNTGRYQLTQELGRGATGVVYLCLLYTSPSPRDATLSRMPSSA